MHRITFATVVLLACMIACSGCVSDERYVAASQEIENQDDVISRLRDDNLQLRSNLDELKNRHEMAKLELDRLKGAGAVSRDVDSLRSELDKLRDSFDRGKGDVTIRSRADGMSFSVAGHVLFNPGQEKLSKGGEKLLAKIAGEIATRSNDIRVEGHTDNTPVVVTIRKYPLGNLQLSGARALNVANYMVNKGGVSRDRMSFAGFGAERPVADNSSEDGRRQNRRVEIVVLKQ